MASWVEDGIPQPLTRADRGEIAETGGQDVGGDQIRDLRDRVARAAPERRGEKCPGCGKDVPRWTGTADGAGRPWHDRCALDRLARDYRTPLSDEEQIAPVEFEVEGQTFALPHHTQIDEIALAPGTEFTNLFVGNQRAIGAIDHNTTLRARDFPGGRVPVHCRAPAGIHLTLQAMVAGLAEATFDEKPRWRILGRRLPVPPSTIAYGQCVAGATATVAPGEHRLSVFQPHAHFRGTLLSCDDWEDWSVSVLAVGNPNTVLHLGALSGPLTAAETCTFQVGEQVAVEATNLADHTRTFRARLYGKCLFEEPHVIPQATAGHGLTFDQIEELAALK